MKKRVNLLLDNFSSLQINNKEVPVAKQEMEVAIKLRLSGKEIIKKEPDGTESKRIQFVTYGRQFSDNDILISNISRQSIDALKESFRDEMKDEDWKLVIELKEKLKIA